MLLNKHNYIFKLIILLITLSVVSSCGFRLRGSLETPEVLKDVHISGLAEYSELNQELQKVLKRSGGKISKDPKNALAIISFQGDSFKKRVLSVDSQGRVAEYELTYQYRFNLTSEEKVLVPLQKIEVTRDLRFDPSNVLAKDAEEAQIRKEMIKFSVRQMMRRIESYLKQQ